ncbi:hypothetical protein [Idiomarina xiamenensis]|uniref:Uncharacterized protein n=1 Tax=Idiomarina xiamenensis 10-D-4 TaxID=740709 RepID=K2JSX8_9GAMM|nr:hypothetical protein [Idiomarina xiamenensis]EKE77602.1 hypothetical protein A10D4_13481 [Idiomarina xiamenensis 10-D-4]
MMKLALILIITVCITDVLGLILLKKRQPNLFREMGNPRVWWTDWDKLNYIGGFIMSFRYFSIVEDFSLKSAFTLQALSLWILLIIFIYEYFMPYFYGFIEFLFP